MKLCCRSSAFGIYRVIATALFLFPAISAHAQGVTATIPVEGSPEAVAVNPVTNKIYFPISSGCNIKNGNNGAVAVIDGDTNSTITVAAEFCPIAGATNPVTNKTYVANLGLAEGFGAMGGGSVMAIDGTTNATNTISNLSLANWYGVNVQRNVTLLHRSKTTIRQPQVNCVLIFDFLRSTGLRWQCRRSKNPPIRSPANN